jgi:hypothetical protein
MIKISSQIDIVAPFLRCPLSMISFDWRPNVPAQPSASPPSATSSPARSSPSPARAPTIVPQIPSDAMRQLTPPVAFSKVFVPFKRVSGG